jgi:hypothetical protein
MAIIDIHLSVINVHRKCLIQVNFLNVRKTKYIFCELINVGIYFISLGYNSKFLLFLCFWIFSLVLYNYCLLNKIIHVFIFDNYVLRYHIFSSFSLVIIKYSLEWISEWLLPCAMGNIMAGISCISMWWWRYPRCTRNSSWEDTLL